MKKKSRKSASHRPLTRSKKTTRRSKRPAEAEARVIRHHRVSQTELARLQEALREAQETLDAIRSGEVDAVVVSGAKGNQIYSLVGAEQPYRVYVERMEEGAVTVSSEALILYCNQRFAEMLEMPLERVIGSDITAYLGHDAWNQLLTVLDAEENVVVKEESLLQQASGGSVPVKFTASRLPLDGQEVMCLVATDLTSQKQHEKTRLAKDVAEQANLAKDAFLAALSHELRTPLSPVLTTTTALAQDASLPPAIRAQLEVVRRNVELEARLIDDLLDLTRIARGKLELRKGPVDLHAVLENAIEICAEDLKKKQQQLQIELGAKQVRTEGDAIRIQQALWNLIRNAVKFTPMRGEIRIRTGNAERTIWVEVSDTGIGFEPERREKLFQAFEQGGRHVTRQFGGLGLGLTITKSVLEAHGGTIRAESEGPGKGARFTLEIPIRRTAGSRSPLPSAAPETPARLLRILLVEDHRDTRATMERWLRRSKHEVASAETAAQALRVAGDAKFDLVISDLGLPDRSGLELMRDLRERHGLQGIAVSGYGMEDDVAKSREAGFIHHLTKPVSLERLATLIAEWSQPALAGG